MYMRFENVVIKEITTELDRLAGLEPERPWKHYVLVSDAPRLDKCLLIRVPGGTVGSIWINEDHIIANILIDTDYVVKTYSADVNEQMQKFIGRKID